MRVGRHESYNILKTRVLAVLAEHGDWMAPATIWVYAPTGPLDNVWTYLARLWRWGLLHRRRAPNGRLEYRISDRGRERLAWLRSPARMKGSEAESQADKWLSRF